MTQPEDAACDAAVWALEDLTAAGYAFGWKEGVWRYWPDEE